MAPSPPLLSLCRRCLIRRIFPAQSLLLKQSISTVKVLQGRSFDYYQSLPGKVIEPPSPFQKEFKKDLRKIREKNYRLEWEKSGAVEDEEPPKWIITVGLEIHAQLNTKRKLFSDARTSHIAPVNTHIAPFDASLPGTQPILNPSVLLPALRAVYALNCTPARESRFDRKHYFYWDQPAGYQITQFYAPLAKDGWLTLFEHDGVTQLEGCPDDDGVRIKIQQIQLEQDTGKTIVSPPDSLVDLNRVGSPLIEIITEPFDCLDTVFPSLVLKKMQACLKAVDACVTGMEWGGLRADVNVSVRLRDGPGALGQRCEIKNVSSIKAVQEAVEAEANRQIRILEAGGTIEGETRGWDAEKGVTRRLRGKEGEVDYRFMPDPDIPPVFISRELTVGVKQFLPPLPDKIFSQLTTEPYDLPQKDAKTLILWDESRASSIEKGVVDYYKDVVNRVQKNLIADQFPPTLKKATKVEFEVIKKRLLNQETKRHGSPREIGRLTGNWVIHELGGHLATHNLSWKENPVDAVRMADLVTYVVQRKITSNTAKNLLSSLVSVAPPDLRSIPQIVEESELEATPLTDDEILALARKVIFSDDNSIRVLAELRDPEGITTGKKIPGKRRRGLNSWLVGCIMKECKGRVEAVRVGEAVSKVVAEKDEE